MKSFDKAVRVRLIEMEKTQKWLMERVRERTGLYMDSSYMSKIIKGNKTPPRVVEAIRDILNI